MGSGPRARDRLAASRGTARTLGVLVVAALCVWAIPAGAAAASPPVTQEQQSTDEPAVGSNTTDDPAITVSQGGTCYEVEPLGDGSQTVEEYYDYDVSNNYSSAGTTDLQENQVSNLFVYDGAEGYSLVLVHDKYRDAPYGGVASMTFTGLPEDGEWAVEDDGYDGRDDQWNHEGDRSEVDWMWYEDRNDGGAFRGLTASDDTAITIDPAFNEDAAAWGEWDASGNEDDRVTEWRLHTGPEDATALDMDEPVTVATAACGQPPEAALSAEPATAEVGESVRLNASNATDDDGVAEYGWDFDGDGTVDLNSTTPHADYTYEETGEYEAAVTVTDHDGETDTATATVTIEESVSDGGGDDGDQSEGDDGDEDDGDEPTDGPDDTPIAELTGPETATVGDTVTLDAGASTDGDGIQSYGWNFDDDNSIDETTTESTVETSFDEAGTYTVSVQVKDENGNDATVEHEIEVSADDGDEDDEADDGPDIGDGDGPDGPMTAPIDAGSDEDAANGTESENDTQSDENGTQSDGSGTAVPVADVEASDDSVDAGESVEVTIRLDDPAEEPGRLPMTISRQSDDGTGSVVDETEVAVPGDGTRNVSVSTTLDEPGEYRASVRNRTAAFSVLAAQTGGAGGQPVTDGGPVTESDPADDPAGDSTDERTDAETTSGNGAGFGAIAAVIGVVLGGIRLARRP